MLGGHLPELIILLVAALVIFGPKRLPEIGGAMGRGIKEFRKSTSESDEPHVEPKVYPAPPPSQIPTTDIQATVMPERDVVRTAGAKDSENK